jgi:serine/threonine protein kinase
VTNYSKDDECIIKTKSCEYEYSIYDHLRGLRGFPPYTKLCCSEAGNHLHLSFLGQPLSQFLNTNLDIFPRKTIYMLAIQLIDRMKALYGKGIAHRSIQPDHIVVNTKTNVVYLISFSRAKFIGKHRVLYGRAKYLTSK